MKALLKISFEGIPVLSSGIYFEALNRLAGQLRSLSNR